MCNNSQVELCPLLWPLPFQLLHPYQVNGPEWTSCQGTMDGCSIQQITEIVKRMDGRGDGWTRDPSEEEWIPEALYPPLSIMQHHKTLFLKYSSEISHRVNLRPTQNIYIMAIRFDTQVYHSSYSVGFVALFWSRSLMIMAKNIFLAFSSSAFSYSIFTIPISNNRPFFLLFCRSSPIDHYHSRVVAGSMPWYRRGRSMARQQQDMQFPSLLLNDHRTTQHKLRHNADGCRGMMEKGGNPSQLGHNSGSAMVVVFEQRMEALFKTNIHPDPLCWRKRFVVRIFQSLDVVVHFRHSQPAVEVAVAIASPPPHTQHERTMKDILNNHKSCKP